MSKPIEKVMDDWATKAVNRIAPQIKNLRPRTPQKPAYTTRKGVEVSRPIQHAIDVKKASKIGEMIRKEIRKNRRQ